MTQRTRRWTTDLVVAMGATLLAIATVFVGIDGSPLRTALVAPFVVFLPGYAVVSALFPERDDERTSRREMEVKQPGVVGTGIGLPARIGLSVAASIAILPAIVLILSVAVGGIPLNEAFLALAGFTLLTTLVALFRRWRTPAEQRFTVPPVTALLGAVTVPFRVRSRSLSQTRTFVPDSRRDVLLNVALAVSVLVFAGSVVGAYAYPTQGQQFTEFYLVTETQDEGFEAADYPQEFTAGESRPLFVSISNHEGERQSYTVVAKIQRVSADGSSVTAERELLRRSRTVDAGETARIRHDLSPTVTGDRLRVQYLLYVGDAPADTSTDSAYRSVHLWISVEGDGGN